MNALLSAPRSTREESWSSLEAEALDMAASWCQMLASARTHTPKDIEVGMSGLAAAIVLCSVSSTAINFLAFRNGEDTPLAGLQALKAVFSIAAPPPAITRFSLALLELLTVSCAPVACATLLGLYEPTVLQQQVKPEPDMKQEAMEDQEPGELTSRLHSLLPWHELNVLAGRLLSCIDLACCGLLCMIVYS